MESCVEPASSDRVNTIISMAGSASEAIIISRLDPMPPKLVPISRPASARAKRALPSSATMAMRSAAGAEHEAGGKGGHERGRDQGGGEDDVGRGPKHPGSVVCQHHLLANQLEQIAVGLENRRASAAQQVRLDFADIAGQQRRERQHQQQLSELNQRVEDQCHTASTIKSTTTAPKTRVR